MMRGIVLLVVDSLRARSLTRRPGARPATPFLDGLRARASTFERAYATECWTLPTHLSMFTGLLPSEHGAHFQTMAYQRPQATLAELAARAGRHTEVITRNSIFDGTLPGATRGFAVNVRVLAELGMSTAGVGVVLALAKPRLRRQLRDSGFFHVLQRERRDFITTLARMGIPADRGVLTRALERMQDWRRRGTPYFLFLNLYDVHAPYSPSTTTPLRSWRTWRGWVENLQLPVLLPRVSTHAYLKPGFRMSERGRAILLDRYHCAIELMDRKLGEFHAEAERLGLLDDTMLVLTSDHGEAFGEHDLYFHDASVYDTHLHVPLWIHHPERPPEVTDDVVSTRSLFDLVRAALSGRDLSQTILDRAYRAAHPVALAEHFHYALAGNLLPQFVQNIAAAVVGRHKAIVRREGTFLYDVVRDPDELAPEAAALPEFLRRARRDGLPPAAVATAAAHLERWGTSVAAA